MGARTGSALLLVSARAVRRGLRARYREQSSTAMVNPRRASPRRATAIHDTLRTISPPPPWMRPRVSRLEPSSGDRPGAGSAIAMSRVRHGKQDAYRCLPPGRDAGGGGPRPKGRGVRLRISSRRQLRGNIYLAKVTRVEPSLQAAFVEYGGNRH